MVEIPDSLRSVFSATIAEQDGTYVVELPAGELEQEAVRRGETYRIAILELVATEGKSPQAGESPSSAQQPRPGGPGEQPTIEIEEVRQNVAFASVIASDGRTL